jgi:hypothetical protein
MYGTNNSEGIQRTSCAAMSPEYLSVKAFICRVASLSTAGASEVRLMDPSDLGCAGAGAWKISGNSVESVSRARLTTRLPVCTYSVISLGRLLISVVILGATSTPIATSKSVSSTVTMKTARPRVIPRATPMFTSGESM